ncbi:phosphoglycerate mutase 2 [Lobosporangium transversale]|uniref:Histidine phosphatase superfamily n=1 Tax=Lobosporangium transversale TaxID=64571 RepID=A0A1Y2GEF9_9FUNG|nr:histidine phosphatase superfamily [Lobosporangium transversale]KAF9913766.1 phosphoglycerate mutase 2 [Lobosporangium transversale]ORZ07206.1 histidine phosphatase superfamily [Lobosporangium transversale]|eukprot:XP_021877869.1 histidine phosphatase superfamily [Lobosporangium transversale]
MTTPSPVHGPYPRVYLVRHGTTEWSQNGRHTGLTDIPLLPSGIEQAKLLSERIFENPFQDMVHIDNISLVLVSPLQRAQQTYQQLLQGGLSKEQREGTSQHHSSCFTRTQARTTSLLTEWDYGDYEGITTKEILKSRPTWSLFGDNAPGGETVEQVSARADAIIELIHNFQRGQNSDGKKTNTLRMPFSGPEIVNAAASAETLRQSEHTIQENRDNNQRHHDHANNVQPTIDKAVVTIPDNPTTRDVLVVAHGHFLRVFAARWLRLDGIQGKNFVLDTASVSVLGYEHTLEERVIKVWNQSNHLWKDNTRIG